jgi:type I restriction enzyme R subunit
LARTLRDVTADPERPTWRGQVAAMPNLDIKLLRPAQITAIGGIERSLAEQRFDRSLVQMATGAGKTHAAVTAAYRLLKHGGFNRVSRTGFDGDHQAWKDYNVCLHRGSTPRSRGSAPSG